MRDNEDRFGGADESKHKGPKLGGIPPLFIQDVRTEFCPCFSYAAVEGALSSHLPLDAVTNVSAVVVFATSAHPLSLQSIFPLAIE